MIRVRLQPVATTPCQAARACASTTPDRAWSFWASARWERGALTPRLCPARHVCTRRSVRSCASQLLVQRHVESDCYGLTANSRHVAGSPLSSCSPRSSKLMPEPATRSTTVLVTRTWPGPAAEQTRSARCIAIPARSSRVARPLRRGARLEPRGQGLGLQIARAHAMARRGPSTVARVPSPVLLTCLPRNRSS